MTRTTLRNIVLGGAAAVTVVGLAYFVLRAVGVPSVPARIGKF